MNIAVMDIGSNTSLLLIARVFSNGGAPKVLKDEVFYTRLAEGFSIQKKSPPLITASALKRQTLFFEKSRRLLDKYSVEQIKCVATSACRRAGNAHQVVETGKQYGFSIKIISGKEEARLSRKGILFGLKTKHSSSLVTLDIGGASTELSAPGGLDLSLPIGSVSLTEEFLHQDPPSQKQILLLTKKIKSLLKDICFVNNFVLIAGAGTPLTLACLERSTDNIEDLHGMRLSYKQVLYWWEYLLRLSLEKRKNLKGMPFYRADVLPAGLSILKQIMEHFNKKECTVSVTGLRQGLLYSFY